MPLMLFRSDDSVAYGQILALRFETKSEGKAAFDYSDGIFLVGGALCLIALISIYLSWKFFLALFVFCFIILWMGNKYQSATERFFISVSGIWYLFVGATIFFVIPMVIRFYSALRHLPKGATFVSKNYFRILFESDITMAPDPLPDPEEIIESWNFAKFKERMGSGRTPWVIVNFIIMAPVFILTLFMRLTLKSTAWFYLSLLFLTSGYNGTDKRIWMDSFATTAISKVRLALSFIATAISALIVDFPAVIAAMRLASDMELPVVPFSLLLVLDWSALYPWQYFSLLTALLTILLYFRLDHMSKHAKVGAVYAEQGFALRSMVWADRLRSLCVIAWISLITPPTLRFFYCAEQVPDWILRGFEVFFDAGSCQLPL